MTYSTTGLVPSAKTASPRDLVSEMDCGGAVALEDPDPGIIYGGGKRNLRCAALRPGGECIKEITYARNPAEQLL